MEHLGIETEALDFFEHIKASNDTGSKAFAYLTISREVPYHFDGIIERLTQASFTVKTKPITRSDHEHCHTTGIDIAVDALQLAYQDEIDGFTFITNHPGFGGLILHLRTLGYPVELMTLQENIARSFTAKADHHTDLMETLVPPLQKQSSLKPPAYYKMVDQMNAEMDR